MDMTSENLAATDQGQVWSHRVIRCGDAVRPLPPHYHSLEDLTFEVGDVRVSLSDYMARSRTAGLLILKGGEIALERYGMGRFLASNKVVYFWRCHRASPFLSSGQA